jgi:hypothetical protein
MNHSYSIYNNGTGPKVSTDYLYKTRVREIAPAHEMKNLFVTRSLCGAYLRSSASDAVRTSNAIWELWIPELRSSFNNM